MGLRRAQAPVKHGQALMPRQWRFSPVDSQKWISAGEKSGCFGPPSFMAHLQKSTAWCLLVDADGCGKSSAHQVSIMEIILKNIIIGIHNNFYNGDARNILPASYAPLLLVCIRSSRGLIACMVPGALSPSRSFVMTTFALTSGAHPSSTSSSAIQA